MKPHSLSFIPNFVPKNNHIGQWLGGKTIISLVVFLKAFPLKDDDYRASGKK